MGTVLYVVYQKTYFGRKSKRINYRGRNLFFESSG
jgi:hypothetical protein